MNRLRREFSVAPPSGIAISALLAVVAALLLVLVAHASPIPFGAAMAVFVFCYGWLVAYVYGDAKRRGMRHRIWALVAAFAPNGIGFIAYFLLRDPLLRPCSACGANARRDFAFCPQCGSPLSDVCLACRRPVEAAWSHCAHCGTNVAGSAVSSAP